MSLLYTVVDIARLRKSFGWNLPSKQAAEKKGAEKTYWTIEDSGNLARIAEALDKSSIAEQLRECDLERELDVRWERYRRAAFATQMEHLVAKHGPCPHKLRKRLRDTFWRAFREDCNPYDTDLRGRILSAFREYERTGKVEYCIRVPTLSWMVEQGTFTSAKTKREWADWLKAHGADDKIQA